MIRILKKNNEKNKSISLKGSLGSLNIFNIDEKIEIPNNVKIILKDKKLKLKGPLGLVELNIMDSLNFFIKKNNILLNFNDLYLKKKKKFFEII